jgi:hypothetical protein
MQRETTADLLDCRSSEILADEIDLLLNKDKFLLFHEMALSLIHFIRAKARVAVT